MMAKLAVINLDDLRATSQGELVTPDSARYDQAPRVWNGAICGTGVVTSKPPNSGSRVPHHYSKCVRRLGTCRNK